MRQDIEFDAEGTTLRGWLYVPEDASGPAPDDRDVPRLQRGQGAVPGRVRRGPSATRGSARWSTTTATWAPATASRGRRSTRGRRCATTAHAITYARTREEVDADRIGVWGSSYSGAHVLVVGAIDRRVKCVVAQVPLISGHENARRLVRADLIAPTQEMFDADREARYRGEPPMMIPVVAPEGEPCALPTPDSYDWFTDPRRRAGAVWINECTLRSVEMFWEYEPGTYLPWISPTPLLMVVAAGDHLTVSDLAIEAYERAREPKRLEVLPAGTSTPTSRTSSAPAERPATGSRSTCWRRRHATVWDGD